MAKRQKEWARRARVRLLSQYGFKCAWCGATDSLEFDCIQPQGHEHHRMSTDTRMSFYHLQHRLGNLQVLCSDCHSQKTARDMIQQDFIPSE